jgi:hypothetical protein
MLVKFHLRSGFLLALAIDSFDVMRYDYRANLPILWVEAWTPRDLNSGRFCEIDADFVTSSKIICAWILVTLGARNVSTENTSLNFKKNLFLLDRRDCNVTAPLISSFSGMLPKVVSRCRQGRLNEQSELN